MNTSRRSFSRLAKCNFAHKRVPKCNFGTSGARKTELTFNRQLFFGAGGEVRPNEDALPGDNRHGSQQVSL
jgi:hypothetical protein